MCFDALMHHRVFNIIEITLGVETRMFFSVLCINQMIVSSHFFTINLIIELLCRDYFCLLSKYLNRYLLFYFHVWYLNLNLMCAYFLF